MLPTQIDFENVGNGIENNDSCQDDEPQLIESLVRDHLVTVSKYPSDSRVLWLDEQSKRLISVPH